MENNTEKFVVVPIFNSFKGDDRLTALRWWAAKESLPEGHQLCIILIEVGNVQREAGIRLRSWMEIEEAVFLTRQGDSPFEGTVDFQGLFNNKDNTFVMIYKGPKDLDTLQFAIDDLKQKAHLHKLIVGCAADEANRTQESLQTIPPIGSLKLPARCSIVLVAKTDEKKKEEDEEKKKKKKEEKEITCMVVRLSAEGTGTELGAELFRYQQKIQK